MRLAALAVLTLVVGCSDVNLRELERGADLVPLRAQLEGKAKGYSLYIAPVAVVCSEGTYSEESPKRYGMHVNRERLPVELFRCLDGVFDRVSIAADTIEGPADERAKVERAKRVAYEQKYDFILLPRVKQHDAVFVDTNGWWWPNALFMAWYFYFPVLWTADEVYGAQVQLEYTLESVRNDHALPGLEHVPVLVDSLTTDRVGADEVPRGPRIAMDDLDRGVDLFGTWFPGKLDRDQWSSHVEPLLEPYARRDLAKRVALDLVGRFARFREDTKVQARALAATHAVVVGVRDYRQGDPCAFADRDAQAFTAWLTGEPSDGIAAAPARTPSKLVKRLLDDQATGSAVLAAIDEAVQRSRPEDTLVFYFAGRARGIDARDASKLGLVCADASRQSQVGSTEILSLARLARALDGGPEHARERVVILDTTFGGGLRGSDGGPEIDAAQLEATLRPLASEALLLASGSKAPANVLQAAQHGLLTWALLDGATGAADGELTWEKLCRHVRRAVESLSRVELAAPQSPLAIVREPAKHVLERD